MSTDFILIIIDLKMFISVPVRHLSVGSPATQSSHSHPVGHHWLSLVVEITNVLRTIIGNIAKYVNIFSKMVLLSILLTLLWIKSIFNNFTVYLHF